MFKLTILKIIFTLKLKLNDFLFNGFGGMSESPSTMFTKQYSIRAMNTNLKIYQLHILLVYIQIFNNNLYLLFIIYIYM